MRSENKTGLASELLVVNQLSKQYQEREFPAVRAVSLLLREGEIAALVGRSGSGKTTLLRLLASLEQAGHGSISFRGQPVKGPDEQLVPGHPSIRLVHQHFELAHRQSVYQNVAQKLRHLHAEEQAVRTIELLRVCRLHPLLDKKVEELSGGEKQRLAIARTLAEEPELLLLDEPFSNLDPVLKEEIKEELFRYIRQQGIAAILVSHDPKDALSLADTLWVLQEGELKQKGSPREVYYKALSPAIAGLFGKMNVCRKETLEPLLSGEALAFLQDFPAGSFLGFRPEALCLVNLANNATAHLQATVLKTTFHGTFLEANIGVGENLRLSAYLPGDDPARPGEQLGFRLKLDQLQVWSGEK